MTKEETRRVKAERTRETYHWRKGRGLCVRCGKEESVKGETLCQMCKLEWSDKRKVYYERNRAIRIAEEQRPLLQRERARTRHLKTRRQNVSKGLCSCGRGEPVPGHTVCHICLEQNRQYKRKYREQARANGLCSYCFKQPARPGKTKCAACAQKLAEQYRRAKAA